jgi:hypothetical protein
LIYALFLINGYPGHGIIRYTHRFIDSLINSNNYQIVHDSVNERTFGQWRKAVGPKEPETNYFHDLCRWLVYRKLSDQPFKEIADI